MAIGLDALGSLRKLIHSSGTDKQPSRFLREGPYYEESKARVNPHSMRLLHDPPSPSDTLVFLLEGLLNRFGSLPVVNHLPEKCWVQRPTSMNFSRSLSKFAKSSFRFLLSAMRTCFFFNRPCLTCSSASRSACSWLMRAVIRAVSSSSACSGCCCKNSPTEINGSCWYL